MVVRFHPSLLKWLRVSLRRFRKLTGQYLVKLRQLQWTVHAKATDGGTIMKAQVLHSVDLDQFKELYIDGRRVIVGKYPNGDLSTQGLYTKDSWFFADLHSWVPPETITSTSMYVQTPNRSDTVYLNYHVGIGGGMSDFNPPYGSVKTGALPHLR